MQNPIFEKCLKELKKTHEKKNADYADNKNPYSNFEYSARVAEPFTNPVDKSFATLIGTKLARISELTKPRRSPNNESLDDSFLDLANYCTIWWSYYRSKNESRRCFRRTRKRVKSSNR